MHINLESDYAVRIVNFLATEYLSDESFEGKRIDAGTIANRTSVSLRFTLKIMRKLIAAGLVKSYKGSRGGYMISKKPAQITLRQVIEAVEGPYQFSRCMDGEYNCSCSTKEDCPFHAVYDNITKMVTDELDKTSFDSLAVRQM